MKKLNMILLSLLAIVFSIAQPHSLSEIPFGTNPFEQDWHLSFEGIEFGIPMNAFCDSLETRGYKLISKDTRYAMFEGNFQGCEKSKVIIYTKYRKVYLAEVYPKACKDWESAVTLYTSFKDSLTSYCDREPAVDENLNIRHVKQGRNYFKKIHRQFDNNNAAYESLWGMIEGHITLDISTNVVNRMKWWRRGKFQVHLIYRDLLKEEIIWKNY